MFAMTTVQILVEYVHPPIPVRYFDWCATFADYEPGDPVGHGETQYEAILDLLENMED